MRQYLDMLEDLITQTDTKIVNAVFLLILSSLIFAVYYFLINPKMKEVANKKETIKSLDENISKNSPKPLKNKIVLKKREISKNKDKKEKINFKILSLKSQLDSINFMFINPINFSSFLDYLLKKSIANNLLIDSIKVEDKKKPFVGSLKINKDIILEGYGSFLNIIRFVRELENKKMLFNLKDFNIETNGTVPNFSCQIEFYGVER